MTPTAIVLIVISAFAHAGWNLFSKRRRPSAAFFLVTAGTAALCSAPFLVYYRQVLPGIPARFWLLLAVTGVFQTLYFIGLAGAYRAGDMSIAYPLARSVPVLLVVLFSLAVGRIGQIGGLALAGMAVVIAGCVILPMKQFRDFKWRNYLNACCLLALMAALGCTGYTLADYRALRVLHDSSAALSKTDTALLYIFLETTCTTLGLAIFVLVYGPERRSLGEVLRRGKVYAGLTGLVIYATYGLVLVAMQFTRDASFVAAFRQLSIPIGAILGMTALKEPRYIPKFIAVALIFIGLVLVSLG